MATVTIQEAAQHLGVSQDTVRRRIRKEELQARQTPTPQGFRWVVELEDLEDDAPAAPTPPHRPDIGGAQVEDGQDLRELVDALRSQLQSQEEELVALRSVKKANFWEDQVKGLAVIGYVFLALFIGFILWLFFTVA